MPLFPHLAAAVRLYRRSAALLGLLPALALGADSALPDPAAQAMAIEFAHAVMRHADAGGRAFGVVDKRAATLWIFDGRGQPLARTPVLVGQAVGDTAPADIGTRPLARVRPHEKITSAGRYITEPGSNTKAEDIVWLDYDAALSMHRVRNVPGESRTQRLATPSVADNRISFGCINVPASFYDRYVDPLFSRQVGVVYVLPESRPLASVFPFAADLAVRPLAQGGADTAR